MNKLTEKEIKREYKYHGKIINVRIDTVELENGAVSTREVVEHKGAVAVLPVDRDGNCYLVEQFRKPIEKILLEIPAGKLDAGETPFECAVRELREETGFIAEEIVELGYIYTTAGFSNEKIHLYLATNLTPGRADPDEDEFLNLRQIKWKELREMAEKGKINDSKTNAAILMALSKVKKYLSDK
ncbi:MAG TPA: NUDIX hydrolase [Thermotogota bacterium]|nr:NUDIX hydrolase [Thermotogota bacterium]HPJ88806.1 NUDIX hydrolase [Thermotogota bacterium]HPR96669.1 NUDIX hydrolase [Thermotogota bacterium]